VSGAGVQVFWLEPLELVQVRLRVYRYTDAAPCIAATANSLRCCDSDIEILREAPRSAWVEDLDGGTHRARAELVGEDDPRWPARCEACGIPFELGAEGTTRQVWAERLYRGAPDGRAYTIRNAPVGAMWHADWLAGRAGEAYTGPDGLSLHVRTPGGDWCVDSQASNCTRPQNQPVDGQPGCTRFVRTHYCWIRHGDPRTGMVHVDKVGETCAAGAGSIVVGNYHGFLHHGVLVSC
jgi:hypothetical protein